MIKWANLFFINPKNRSNNEKKFKTKKYDLLLSLSDEKDHSIAFSILIKK